MKNYQFIISLKEKVSKPVQAIQKSMGRLSTKVDVVKRGFDKLPSSIKQLETKLSGLKKAQKESFSVSEIKAYQKQIRLTENELSKIQKNTGSTFGAIKGKLGGLPSLVAGAFAVSKVVGFGSSVVDTLAQFEKMEAVLTNTLGSKSAAQAALQQIKDFAASTPFQVDELSESFVKLANQNFKPTLDQMRQMGDLAAANGKSYDQLTEAFIDAGQSEFERLKEFGIKAKKSAKDGTIEFKFKGISTTVQEDEKAVQKYLLSLGDLEGVQGGMAAISETTGGKLSNLADKFTALKLSIGEKLKPVIAAAIDLTSKFVEKMGHLVEWLSANREMVLKVTKVTAKLLVGYLALTKGLKVVVGTVNMIRGGFTKLLTLFRGFVLVLSVVRNAMVAFNLVMMANPIGAIIVGITALVVAIAAVVKYWDQLKAAVWAVVEPLVDLIDNIFPGFKEGLSKLAGWFKEAFEYMYSWIKPVVEGISYLADGVGKAASAVKGVAMKGAVKLGLADEAAPITKEDFDRWRKFAAQASALHKKQKAITGLGNEDADPAKPKTATGKPKATNTSITQGLSSVVGDQRSVKNINISIGKLVEQLIVKTATFKESPQRIKEEVTKALIQSVNDVNYAT